VFEKFLASRSALVPVFVGRDAAEEEGTGGASTGQELPTIECKCRTINLT